MTATIRTAKHKRGYRVIRRVSLHHPARQPFWQRLWTQLWSGGSPEEAYARKLRLDALAAEQDRHAIARHLRLP